MTGETFGELCDRIAAHLAGCRGASLSRGELARALGEPYPTDEHKRLMRALHMMVISGRVIAELGPRSENDGRMITRWRAP